MPDPERGDVARYAKSVNTTVPDQALGLAFPEPIEGVNSFHVKSAIKFEGQIAPKADDFGLKVHGVLFNDWLDNCHPF